MLQPLTETEGGHKKMEGKNKTWRFEVKCDSRLGAWIIAHLRARCVACSRWQ